MSNKSDSLDPSLLPPLAALIAKVFTTEQIIEASTGTGEQQLLFSSTGFPSQHAQSSIEAAFHDAYPGQGGETLMSLGSSSEADLATQYSNAANRGAEHTAVDFYASTAVQSGATMIPTTNHIPLTLQAAASEHTCQLSGGTPCTYPLHGTIPSIVPIYEDDDYEDSRTDFAQSSITHLPPSYACSNQQYLVWRRQKGTHWVQIRGALSTPQLKPPNIGSLTRLPRETGSFAKLKISGGKVTIFRLV
ncbi:hypothetical protein BU15DRAFT_74621 [Melanogaster broomeanus]|nr:hypothetical protein BU15DRAFT_74621 [Melanogaster broomeanus]